MTGYPALGRRRRFGLARAPRHRRRGGAVHASRRRAPARFRAARRAKGVREGRAARSTRRRSSSRRRYRPTACWPTPCEARTGARVPGRRPACRAPSGLSPSRSGVPATRLPAVMDGAFRLRGRDRRPLPGAVPATCRSGQGVAAARRRSARVAGRPRVSGIPLRHALGAAYPPAPVPDRARPPARQVRRAARPGRAPLRSRSPYGGAGTSSGRRRIARPGAPIPRLAAFRWLLEELRVSLFAQELKTPFPVSFKRVEKAWTELSR